MEESNVTFLFLEKTPWVVIFRLTFPSGWDPSRGQDAQFLPIPALRVSPAEVVRNMEAIYSGELISRLENGPVGQAGGEKHPVKSPWGAGGSAGGLSAVALLCVGCRGPAVPGRHVHYPLCTAKRLAPRPNVASPRGNGNAYLHHFGFLLNATMEMVNLFLPIPFFLFFFFYFIP